jgi:hypothetical protein
VCELEYKKKEGSRQIIGKKVKITTQTGKTWEMSWKTSHQPSAAIAKNPFFRCFHELRSIHGYPKKGEALSRVGVGAL